jgi:hypothetical protein
LAIVELGLVVERVSAHPASSIDATSRNDIRATDTEETIVEVVNLMGGDAKINYSG